MVLTFLYCSILVTFNSLPPFPCHLFLPHAWSGFCIRNENSLTVLLNLKQSTSDEESTPQLPPLYITEFVLEPNQLLFKPDEEEFQDGIAEVMKRFQECVLSVMNLVPDPYFDAFTRFVHTKIGKMKWFVLIVIQLP